MSSPYITISQIKRTNKSLWLITVALVSFIVIDFYVSLSMYSDYEAQEIIIADLKKQLEPKNCNGCKWLRDDGSNECDYVGFRTCVRYKNFRKPSDYYEPKDEQ